MGAIVDSYGLPESESGDCDVMPSIMDAIMGRERRALRVQPRSVVPGRQRWDVDVVLGRPRVAELLEAELRKSRGVGPIRANPVTGRLLVYHDVALSCEEVDQLVREAVALAVRQDRALTRSSSPEPEVMLARVRQRHRTTPSFALACGAVVGMAALGGYLLRSPLVRLGSSSWLLWAWSGAHGEDPGVGKRPRQCRGAPYYKLLGHTSESSTWRRQFQFSCRFWKWPQRC